MRLLAMAFIAPGLVWAHDYKLGHLRMDHPYALIKTEPATRLEVYFRNFKNDGSQSDRLLGVRAPVAGQAIIRTETHSADHALTWVPVQSLDVPAKGQVAMRHDARDGYQFLLTEIKRPLKVGDSFPLTLTFEKSGEKEVMVWIQAPRNASSAHQH
jgi:hypothetical protein